MKSSLIASALLVVSTIVFGAVSAYAAVLPLS